GPREGLRSRPRDGAARHPRALPRGRLGARRQRHEGRRPRPRRPRRPPRQQRPQHRIRSDHPMIPFVFFPSVAIGDKLLIAADPILLFLTTLAGAAMVLWAIWLSQDRKSTRLNSSHVKISYAVSC